MMDIELFAETRIRERENYFASPQFKARASWRSGLAAIARRQPRRERARRAGEAQPGPVTVF